MRQIKPGDIGFTFKRRNLFSRIIYAVAIWRTTPKSPLKVSHCFVCLDFGMIVEATFGGIAIVNMKKYFDGQHDVYIKTPAKPIDHYAAVKGEQFARDSAGTISYSFLELLNIFLTKWFRHRVFSYRKKDMICSEFVVNYYLTMGIDLVGKDPAATTPVDVFESDLLKEL